MGNDGVNLELQFGVEKIGQSTRVDERGGTADEQNTAGIRFRKVRLLRGLDAIPHDAGVASFDAETMDLTLGEELVGDLALEKHHFGRATRVISLELRTVDVDGKDTAQGTQLVN